MASYIWNKIFPSNESGKSDTDAEGMAPAKKSSKKGKGKGKKTEYTPPGSGEIAQSYDEYQRYVHGESSGSRKQSRVETPVENPPVTVGVEAIPEEQMKAMPELYSDTTEKTNKESNLYPDLSRDEENEEHIEKSIKQLNEINTDFIPLNKEVVKFMGTKNDLVFIALEEKLIQLILRLDDIETRNCPTIKQRKAFLIPLVKGTLESLRDKAEKISEDLTSVDSSSVSSDILPRDDIFPDCKDFEVISKVNVSKNIPLESEPEVNFDFNQMFHMEKKEKVVRFEKPQEKPLAMGPPKVDPNKEAFCSKNDKMYTEKVMKNEDSVIQPAYAIGDDDAESKRNRVGLAIPNILDNNIASTVTAKSQIPLHHNVLHTSMQNLNVEKSFKTETKYETYQATESATGSTSSTDPIGPVQLFKFNDHGKFELNEESLCRIFARKELKNRKIAIVSIVGAFRTGKSFMLNFMLRYLRAKGHSGWLSASCDATVDGFSWRGGKERDTTGILMWPEPFLVSDDLAVLLMDTQGTFDNKTTMQANTFIFAFSTLVSSVQIFNISKRIQMDDLTNLQYFLEFGRLIHSECDVKAFQKLIFLIRDWKFPEDDPFGFAGGEKVLGTWMKTDNTSASHEQADMIMTCFKEIQCYLMPNPGEIVDTQANFRGNLSDIKPEFLNYLVRFIESVLSPTSLNAKMVGRNVVNATELTSHMRNWVQHLQQDDMQPKTLFESMAEMSHEKAVTECVDTYLRNLQPQISLDCDILKIHEMLYADALRNFDSAKKFGNTVMENKYRKILSDTLRDKYERISQNLQDQREKERIQKQHQVLDHEFILFQSQLNGFILATNYEISLQQVYNEMRDKAMENLRSQLSSLLPEQKLQQELANMDKRMFTYIKGLEPNYFKKKARDEQKHQVEDISKACDSALVLYRNLMEAKCGNPTAVPNVVPIHTESWNQVLAALKPIMEKNDAGVYGTYLEKLKFDIKDLYNRYRTQNSEKLRRERGEELRWSLRDVQSECIRKFRADLEKLCVTALTKEDMNKIAGDVRNRALSVFEVSVKKYGAEDCRPYFTAAKNEIAEIIKQYNATNVEKTSKNNEKRIIKAKTTAVRKYVSQMKGLGLHNKAIPDLHSHHRAALEEALDQFSDLRTDGIDCRVAIDDVKAEIKEKYEEIEKKNSEMAEKEQDEKCKNTMQTVQIKALGIYKETMIKKCKNMRRGGNFEEIHSQSTAEAFEEFDKILNQFDHTNIHVLEARRSLIKDLDKCKEEFENFQSEIEKSQNVKCKEAVTECFKHYNSYLETETENGKKWVSNLDAVHHKYKIRAVHNLRELILNIGRNLSSKEYENLLNVDIDERWQTYKSRNNQLNKKIQEDKLLTIETSYTDSLNQYKVAMSKHIVNTHVLQLSLMHSVERDHSINAFKQRTRQCDSKLVAEYCTKLEQNIKETFEDMETKVAKQERTKRLNEHGDSEGKHAIGIDLGTTYSCVAVYVNEKIQVIENKIGKKTTPSTVYFSDNKHDIGDKAIHEGIVDSKNCVSEVKRIIGRKFDDPIVEKVIKLWNFKVKEEKGLPVIEVTKGEKKTYTPENISALVLTEMKEQAEAALGCKVHDAVVTIPSNFNELQREATKNACHQAGLNILRMINEPTAAALAYGIQCKSARLRKILVFDFGGGTLDVSILIVQGGKFTVKASKGDNHLGGEDFDDKMTKYISENFETKHSIKLDTIALRRLRRQSERVKRNLTDLERYDLEIYDFVDKIGLNQTITREQFETVNAELFTRALIPVKECLTDASMTIEDIDEVVMVGGSSRIPKIQEMVKEYFKGKELNNTINPDEAIAYGAAIQAAVCIDQYKGKISIEDITPFSLGTDVLFDKMSIVVPKNTTIPVTRTETYFTMSDNQRAMQVEVYQGEDTKNKRKNTYLGEFKLDNLKKGKAGSVSAEITFHIDADGILHVTAKEKSADNVKSIKIEKTVV